MSGFLYAVIIVCLTCSCVRSISGLVRDVKTYREQRELKRKLLEVLQVDYVEEK